MDNRQENNVLNSKLRTGEGVWNLFSTKYQWLGVKKVHSELASMVEKTIKRNE